MKEHLVCRLELYQSRCRGDYHSADYPLPEHRGWYWGARCRGLSRLLLEFWASVHPKMTTIYTLVLCYMCISSNTHILTDMVINHRSTYTTTYIYGHSAAVLRWSGVQRNMSYVWVHKWAKISTVDKKDVCVCTRVTWLGVIRGCWMTFICCLMLRSRGVISTGWLLPGFEPFCYKTVAQWRSHFSSKYWWENTGKLP